MFRKPLVLILLAVFAAVSMQSAADSAKRAKVGEKFIDFTARTVNKEKFVFSQAIKGKTCILKFGALWCGWCEKMWPELKKVHDEMGDKVVIVEVDLLNPSRGETEEKVRASVKRKKTPWEVVLDKGDVAKIYLPPRSGIPHSVVIGPDGIVKTRISGYRKYEDLKPLLEAIINGEPLPGTVGAVFPDFTLKDLSGNEFHLYERLKKGPVVIKFGATWCGPCQKLHEPLTKLYKKYRKKASIVEIDLIDPRRGETVEKVREYNEKLGTKYPVLLDYKFEVFGHTQATSIPVTLVIDKYHRISAKFVGVVGYDDIEAALKKAFAAKKPKKKRKK